MIIFCSKKDIVPAFSIPWELEFSLRLAIGEMLNYL